MISPNEILLKAAEHMEKVGFHQGNFFKRDDDRPWETEGDTKAPCCARGAMQMAVYFTEGKHDNLSSAATDEAINLLTKHLGLIEEANKEPIACWNDEPGRTKEEVVAALRGAAALEVSQ